MYHQLLYILTQTYRNIHLPNLVTILKEPRKCIIVLQVLGFKLINNNRRLLYKNKKDINIFAFGDIDIFSIYHMNGMSPRLFDLSCKQLLLKKQIQQLSLLQQQNRLPQPNGVYTICNVSPSKEEKSQYFKNVVLPLIQELLLLPNPNHCFRIKMNSKALQTMPG